MKIYKKAWLLSYAFFAWLAANSAYADVACQLDKKQLQQLEVAEVSRVVDGDTFVLKTGERVRLIGIDTPEIGNVLAAEASEALAKLVAKQRIYIQQDEEPRDKHQRLLAHVFLANGQNVAAHLLQQGLGFLVAIPPNVAWLACHQAMAQEAAFAKRGVWLHYPAKSTAAMTAADTGFQHRQGKLLSLELRNNIWWLQFEGPLVARITPPHQAYFNWQELKAMVGKNVRLTGWVVDRSQQRQMKKYSPLMLLLTHPAHIEVL